MEDTNPITGEASSDIFVRGFLQSVGEDDQSTDVHYMLVLVLGWHFYVSIVLSLFQEHLIISIIQSAPLLGQ